jgi:hypothetical protein
VPIAASGTGLTDCSIQQLAANQLFQTLVKQRPTKVCCSSLYFSSIDARRVFPVRVECADKRMHAARMRNRGRKRQWCGAIPPQCTTIKYTITSFSLHLHFGVSLRATEIRLKWPQLMPFGDDLQIIIWFVNEVY